MISSNVITFGIIRSPFSHIRMIVAVYMYDASVTAFVHAIVQKIMVRPARVESVHEVPEGVRLPWKQPFFGQFGIKPRRSVT